MSLKAQFKLLCKTTLFTFLGPLPISTILAWFLNDFNLQSI
jgi:hypothetical protein